MVPDENVTTLPLGAPRHVSPTTRRLPERPGAPVANKFQLPLTAAQYASRPNTTPRAPESKAKTSETSLGGFEWPKDALKAKPSEPLTLPSPPPAMSMSEEEAGRAEADAAGNMDAKHMDPAVRVASRMWLRKFFRDKLDITIRDEELESVYREILADTMDFKVRDIVGVCIYLQKLVRANPDAMSILWSKGDWNWLLAFLALLTVADNGWEDCGCKPADVQRLFKDKIEQLGATRMTVSEAQKQILSALDYKVHVDMKDFWEFYKQLQVQHEKEQQHRMREGRPEQIIPSKLQQTRGVSLAAHSMSRPAPTPAPLAMSTFPRNHSQPAPSLSRQNCQVGPPATTPRVRSTMPVPSTSSTSRVVSPVNSRAPVGLWAAANRAPSQGAYPPCATSLPQPIYRR